MSMDDIGKVNHRVKDDIGKVTHREEETIFNDFTARRNAIIKALTEENDICEFRNLCEKYAIPENEYLGLYGLPDGTWKVMSTGEVPLFLPHSKLYELPNSEEDQNEWLAKVADDSDTWLFTVFFTYCSMSGYDNNQSERLFDKINELPTIYEVVTGNDKNQEVATEKAKKRVEDKSTVINELPTIYEVVTGNDKNQEVATEKAKKRVEDKSTVSGQCKAFSNSEVVQQGMSSSRLVKDLKREGKKAITKREPPMRSAIQTRSKARRI